MAIRKIMWYEPLMGEYPLETYRAAYPSEFKDRIVHVVSRSYQLNAYETKITCSSGKLTFGDGTIVCDSDECVSCCARKTDGPQKIHVPVPLLLKGYQRVYILSHHFIEPALHRERFLNLLTVLESFGNDVYVVDEGGDEGTYFCLFSDDPLTLGVYLRRNRIKAEFRPLAASV